MQLTLATYNIHRCIGADRKKRPARISQVLTQIDPDIVALQEVEYSGSVNELDFVAREPGLHVMPGPTMDLGSSKYGNVLISRYPPLEVRKINLSHPGRERRGAIDVDIDCRGTMVRVIATHLGLAPGERRSQAKKLLSRIDDQGEKKKITILMGDMNEWFLWGRPLRWIHGYFGRSPDIATYPARLPIFALDKIWCHPVPVLRDLRRHATPQSRVASDHLPLVGVLNLSHGGGEQEELRGRGY
jgi:endonuclease/exonuclease/phosphatase family metal-dependent hydrolase